MTAALIHGDAGTTLGSLAVGVPLVVWLQGANRPGCGIGLAPGPVDPSTLREAVPKVLTDRRTPPRPAASSRRSRR